MAIVSVMTAASVDANRRAQAEMYGEPLGDLIGGCAATLGLTQGRVAELLGISAPMLSQLINAHRIKIGNPAAVHRLQAMYAVAQRVAAGEQSAVEGVRALESDESDHVVTNSTAATGGAETIQEVFRAAGSVDDYVAAAAVLRERYPAIAALLLTYGARTHG